MALKRAGFLETCEEACRRLASGPLPPLLVLSGPDAFLKERLLQAWVSTAGGDAETVARRPEEKDAAFLRRLLRLWTTPTLFGGGRPLVCRQPFGTLRPEAAAALAEVLAGNRPPQPLALTLTSLDGRSRLARQLKQAGGWVDLPPLRDSPPPWQRLAPGDETELERWTRAEAGRLDLKLERDAARELTRRLGNEPARVARKLEHLGVLAGAGARVDASLVERHVPFSGARLLGLYEDALRAGDTAGALGLLDRMQRQGVLDPFGRLVSASGLPDMVLRSLLARLARLVDAHESLDDDLRAALEARPWQRSSEQKAALDEVLGPGAGRVFLERDLRETRAAAVGQAFDLTLDAARRLRDGRGLSLPALTVRLTRAMASAGARP